MVHREPLTRRGFLGRAVSATGAALAAPYVLTSSALGADGRPPAGERIVMGAIGTGGRGTGDMRGFMNFSQVQMVAVCDVVRSKREQAKGYVDQKYGNADCVACNDFREITRRDDVDAIMCGTPDHWHALVTIDACRHGKDVYCEKPISLTIREGRQMVEAARRYERVVSGGSQRVLGDYGKMAQAVRAGAAGKVREVFVNVGGPSKPCNLAPQAVPPGIDWDLWLGPAPWAPFNSGRLRFRPWRDYSGGGMTDWGAHKFAGAMFACEVHHTGPVEVLPPEASDRGLLTYVWEQGFRMYHGGGGNLRFVGTHGTVPGQQAYRTVSMPGYHGRGGILGDFVHCVRTREKPFRDIEYSHRAATVCHLGNIAYRLKRPLKWDPDAERFVGDDEANRMVDRPKREPWRV